MSEVAPVGRPPMPPGDPAAPSDDARAELARRQEELVRALVLGAPIPAGFETRRVAVAAHALLRKRAGEAAWHVPQIRAELGPRFVELFVEWARGSERRGSAAEARAFTEYLIERKEVDSALLPATLLPATQPPAASSTSDRNRRPWWRGLLR